MSLLNRLYGNRKKPKPFIGNPPPNNSISTFLYDSDQTSFDPELLRISLEAISDSLFFPTDFGSYGLSKSDQDSLSKTPGEHYQIISKLVQKLSIKNALEIGTFRGLGTLSIAVMLRNQGKTFTNDLLPWSDFDSVLSEELIVDLGIVQKLEDFSDITNQAKFEEICGMVDFLFLDGPKDGEFEYKILKLISTMKQSKAKYLFIDDIKFENMIPLWRSIDSPKLDITSFGHWSGSGLVDIRDGLKINTNLWKNLNQI